MFLQHSAVPCSSHTDHLKFTRCHKCLFSEGVVFCCGFFFFFCPKCSSISLVLLGESPMHLHPFTVQPRTLSLSSVFTDHLPGDGASHTHNAIPRTLKGLLFFLCLLMESNTQFWSGSLILSPFGQRWHKVDTYYLFTESINDKQTQSPTLSLS